jgi:hypothetical protein
MPVPKTKDVNKLIKWFRKDKPSWDMKRVIAAAYSVARKQGAKLKKKKDGNK